MSSNKNQSSKQEDPDNWLGKVLQHKDNVYVPISKLGAGSYASVWMCYFKNKKKLMAIKIFKDTEQKSGKKETDIYQKFNQYGIKNTIRMHDKFTHNDNICLVFDLMIGSLYDMIKKGGCSDNTSFNSGFSLDFVIKVTHAVLETLVDLHSRHIIHGDVKAENILLHGKTKIHEDLTTKLDPKSSIKKIVESIKEIHRTSIKSRNHESDSSEESDESEEESESEESERSGMSTVPEKIVISDSEEEEGDEEDTNDGDENDNNQDNDSDNDEKNTLNDLVEGIKKKNKCHAQFEIDRHYIDNPELKLSDLGSCVDMTADKKPIGLQTKYYKSPEILLGLPYDESCDIWALGCTIYELLTGAILFDPDEYETDKKRCMLHQIFAKLGKFPRELIEVSPLKQVFFTDSCVLKGAIYTDDFYLTNAWTELLENISGETAKKYLMIDLMLDMLKMDPRKRISACDALQHPVFKMYCVDR